MSETKPATELQPIFADQSGKDPALPQPWPSMIVPRASIEREIERLAELPKPGNGRRASAVVHPLYTGPGQGLTPATDIVINVLKPGEETAPIRRNANQVELCISGSGVAEVNGQELALGKWDICNIPSMQRYRHRNNGNDLFVRLTYTNTPLLEKLGVHFFEEDPRVRRFVEAGPRKLAEGAFDDELPGGARLQSFEYLAEIRVAESRAHRWGWNDIRNRLAFAPHTDRRQVVLLYNPATERLAGTSASFFVAVTGGTTTAPMQPDRYGHRHTSATFNYWLMGSGKNIVNGETLYWNQGDLLLAAPSWAQHSVYWESKDGSPTDWCSVIVQDHPLHIGMESLIWQEGKDKPIAALGAEVDVDDLRFTGRVNAR